MNKSMRLLVVGALLLATASVAVAADRTTWVGRDTDSTKTVWSCTNTSGDNWTLKRNGTDWGEYETTATTKEYIEVQAKGTKTFERLRLYSDKVVMNEKGSKFRWLTLAKGKWH